jgi:predicted Zn-dependent peptidase
VTSLPTLRSAARGRRRAALPLAAALALLAPLAASAQQRPAAAMLDRAAPPPVAPTPELRVPAWTTATLSNGARLVVAPKRDLPLVNVSVNFDGGAHQFEPAAKAGLASMTAGLLAEGTTTKTGEQLSEAQQLLGTSITAGIAGERGTVAFEALRDKLAPALALMADMMLNPVFPADALERLRARTLVQLVQAKDQPTAISANVFARTLYGTHPYGRVVTEATVRAVTRDDVVAFHKAYFQPARATITVTGDVDPAQVKAEIERALAAWPAGGTPASFDYPALPAPAARTIYLVDKPKAAQSSFAIGLPGPPRDTPDYYALQVMNTILGGAFQSRLNHNIREVKGWSYGVGSSFAMGKGPGAFRTGGEIVTAKTDSALLEFMKELQGVHGGRPFTDAEIAEAKASLVQRLPRSFASVGALAGSITTLYLFGLPMDYYQSYADRIDAVTAADLDRVAKRYIDLDRLAIVIVGDRATIEGPLARTGVAPIVVLDVDGKRVTPSVTP